MEKQMQQLSLNSACDKSTKNQSSTSRSKCKNQKPSIPKSKSVFQKTRELIDKRINELEIYYKKLSKKQNNPNDENSMEDECAKMNLIMNQLNALRELNEVHLSDVKKIKRAKNKQRKKIKKNFIKLMGDFQRYKELLSLLQNAEVREAFRTGTNGAIKLSENELDYLYWLNMEINPSINSVENKTIWQKKLRESTLKAVEIAFGSNKEIISSWTGQNTKHLLERISKCEFFSGRTMWVNMEIFTRTKANAFSNAFQTYPYYYCYDEEVACDEDAEFNPKGTFNDKTSKCNLQSFNNNTATDSNVQQCNSQAEKKPSSTMTNTKENYKFVKRSDKPDDYYLCFNYYPARFTADVKVPPSLARRPPPGIFRCDI
ncbi:unnamed protein product [Cercopithifilaria johnstoni]|uniref:Caprin-1 dimerization domain-containing protein n=1 Tax=Cercopithifilaria johnstoni TaxID=2874296 RepID=A0A8J2M7H5_9BILA|nr:unnamed protein product [Cercopithifilaria johnstoni]